MIQIDPMADKYGSVTTYNYSMNTPVVFNDPLGDDLGDIAYGRSGPLDVSSFSSIGWIGGQ